MIYTFEYEEKRVYRFEVNTLGNLGSAIRDAYPIIDNILPEDEPVFVEGTLKMPLKDNFFPYLEDCGEQVPKEDIKDHSIVVDFW